MIDGAAGARGSAAGLTTSSTVTSSQSGKSTSSDADPVARSIAHSELVPVIGAYENMNVPLFASKTALDT